MQRGMKDFPIGDHWDVEYTASMIAETIPGLDGLNPSQKLLLAGELWEAALAADVDVRASDALMDELDRRDREFRDDPSAFTSWEDAVARIRASRG